MDEMTNGPGNQGRAAEEVRRLEEQRAEQARVRDQKALEKERQEERELDAARQARAEHAHKALQRVEQGNEDQAYATWRGQVERDIDEQRCLDDDYTAKRDRVEEASRDKERACATSRETRNDERGVREQREQERTQERTQERHHAPQRLRQDLASQPGTLAQARLQSAAAASEAGDREAHSRAYLTRQDEHTRKIEAARDPESRQALGLQRDLDRERYLADQKTRLAANPAAVGREHAARFRTEAAAHRVEIAQLTKQVMHAEEQCQDKAPRRVQQAEMPQAVQTNAAHQRLEAHRAKAQLANAGQQPPASTLARADEHQARGIELKAQQAAARAREQAAEREQTQKHERELQP